MKLHELKPPAGSKHAVKRLGRGDSSGHGGTSTRGHKGHHARSGFSRSFNIEGGQMPLARRLPKRGFARVRPVQTVAVNVGDIVARCQGPRITLDALKTAGCVRSGQLLKVLGEGSVTRAVEIHAHAFSRKAREKIEKAGGTAVVVPQE